MSSREIQEVEGFLKSKNVYAAIIYGSYARDEEYNDIDIAVFTDTDIVELVAELPDEFDIQRFEDLPLYIRNRVLEEGELLFYTDKDRFYDEVIEFTKEYEDFKPLYREYLEGVKQRG